MNTTTISPTNARPAKFSGLRRRLMIAVVACAGVIAFSATAASAQPSTPYATLTCTTGRVYTSAPSFSALQGTWGSTQPDVRWQPILMQLTSRGWVVAQQGQTFGGHVLANTGPGLGGIYGYAGNFYNLTTGASVPQVYFNVTRGYTYAIANAVVDGSGVGVWAYASTPTGFTACVA